MVDSDEDSESVVSSNVSDLGSPMPSTPRTPCMTPTLSQRMTDTEDSQVKRSKCFTINIYHGMLSH